MGFVFAILNFREINMVARCGDDVEPIISAQWFVKMKPLAETILSKRGMPMLSKPQHGWTYFSLSESSYSLSYLSNIPLEWLERAIVGLETLLPFEVYGYCEPGNRI